jgi:hypothetical protein
VPTIRSDIERGDDMNEKKPKPNTGGIIVTYEDMYELILETRTVLQQILIEIEVMKNQLKSTNEADERSREALNKAENALALADKLENRVMWVVGVVITELIAGAIGALIYFAQKGLS